MNATRARLRIHSAAKTLVVLVALLQLLAPFLHAHFGASYLNGWHMHLVPIAVETEDMHAPSLLSDTRESDELEVEQGLPPDDHGRVLPDTLWLPVLVAAAALALLVAAVAAHVLRAPEGAPRRARPRRWRRPNFPPPSIAPPLRS